MKEKKDLTFGERLDRAQRFFDCALFSIIAGLTFAIAGPIASAFTKTLTIAIIFFILYGICLILFVVMAWIGIRTEFGENREWKEMRRKAALSIKDRRDGQ